MILVMIYDFLIQWHKLGLFILFINNVYKMQEQIHRIRNSDYSSIDERLYSNLGMTSDLQCTITKLAQLQRYLKTQINSIEDQGQKQAVMKASQVILTMNIDSSQVNNNQKCQCIQGLKQVLQRVNKIKKSFKISRETIKREIKDCLNDFKDIFDDHFAYVMNFTARKTNQNAKYKMQIQNLQTEIQDLKYKNAELISKLEQWQDAKKRRKEKTYKQDQNQVLSIYTSTTNQITSRDTQLYLQSIITQPIQNHQRNNSKRHFSSLCTNEDVGKNDENQGPRLPMPLRRDNSLNKYGSVLESYNSCEKFNEKGKQINKQLSTATMKHSPKKASISWNQTAVNPVGLYEKQNEMLRLKVGGADNKNRRKSTKKLKLFSLI